MIQKMGKLLIGIGAKTKAFVASKHKGFDPLIITIVLILLALIASRYFNNSTLPVLENSITTMDNNISDITSEVAGQ